MWSGIERFGASLSGLFKWENTLFQQAFSNGSFYLYSSRKAPLLAKERRGEVNYLPLDIVLAVPNQIEV